MDVVYPTDYSSGAVQALLDSADSDILFVVDPRVNLEPGPRMLERMAAVIRDTGCGLVYADGVDNPRIDYQKGSIRDGFDFGPIVGVRMPAARQAGIGDDWKWGGLYDLRLRISEKYPIVRIPEPLYTGSTINAGAAAQNQFDYVDPRNREYQVEMESVATAHLKRLGAWLPPRFEQLPEAEERFPVTASIIIPVRNRERTIIDAVQSALAQRADFEFNIIVIDNHSTDRTTEIVRSIGDERVEHVVPPRNNLGIGACWNEAIYSDSCGEYAVQLDSDDLYTDERVLARMVAEIESGPYAMVVGSYTVVDFALKQIPPGIIDHREWTRDNGRNNALRVNGLGAPRAFRTSVLRRIGFPNVSYGEDYAVALRISRDYEISRIYEPLYLCRRWEGNSDSALPRALVNQHDHYKDWLRTLEIQARIRGGRVHPSR